MKKTIAVLLTGVMASALLLSGCEASKGLENDDIKITQYKGIEIDEVEKAKEVTDDDVDSFIKSMQECIYFLKCWSVLPQKRLSAVQ